MQMFAFIFQISQAVLNINLCACSIGL